MPRIRHPDARPDVVPHPLHAMAVLPAGKYVEAHFRPTGQALGNLERLVQLVVGGIHAIDLILLPVRGKVGMELNHGALWFYGGGAIDLDFVIALSAERLCARERAPVQRQHAQPITHIERAS